MQSRFCPMSSVCQTGSMSIMLPLLLYCFIYQHHVWTNTGKWCDWVKEEENCFLHRSVSVQNLLHHNFHDHIPTVCSCLETSHIFRINTRHNRHSFACTLSLTFPPFIFSSVLLSKRYINSWFEGWSKTKGLVSRGCDSNRKFSDCYNHHTMS